MMKDVDVQPIEEDVPSREDKRRDIDHFFQSPIEKSVNGKVKKYCICKLCPYISHTSVICLLMRSVLTETRGASWSKSQLYAVIWRHITQWVSYYSFISDLDFCQGKYHKWAQDANYESRLPGDIKKLLNMQLKHSIMTSGRRNSRSGLFHILTRSSIRLRLNG